jgi:Ala-tRNA(Pro) deacylase
MGLLQVNLVKKFLNCNKISYHISEHEPVFTSKQAAKVRQSELKTGVKALMLKSEKGAFIMGLVAADRRLDLKKLAKIVETKKLQLASPQEVLDVTGCEVGSVPPFGNLFGLTIYLDKSVLISGMVNFNAGLHTISIQMKGKDLIKVLEPIIGSFSKN